MYCAHCGNELSPEATFCDKCGKLVAKKIDQVTNVDVSTPCVDECTCTQTQDQQVKDSKAASILKFSILSLCFGITGLLSVLGIIFSFVARKKINNYIKLYGETNGKASVGKSINIGATIVSWVFFGAFVMGLVTGVLDVYFSGLLK